MVAAPMMEARPPSRTHTHSLEEHNVNTDTWRMSRTPRIYERPSALHMACHAQEWSTA